MDEMKIGSKLITGVVSKLIKRAIKDKIGYDMDIQLNELRATVIDGTAHVHLDIDAELEKDELNRLLGKAGF